MRALVKGLLKENIEHKENRTMCLLKSGDEEKILSSRPNPMPMCMCTHVHVCTCTHTYTNAHTYNFIDIL